MPRYGKDGRYGTSFRSTASPSVLFGDRLNAGVNGVAPAAALQHDIQYVVTDAAAVGEPRHVAAKHAEAMLGDADGGMAMFNRSISDARTPAG